MRDIGEYRVGGGECRLGAWRCDDDAGWNKDDCAADFKRLNKRFVELTQLLYAERRRGLLVVLQGMDTSGKDSTTRAVFKGVSPTGIDATSFKAPTLEESGHDFLWRVHRHAPGAGEIAIFNRSHYEDVLIVRVHNLVPAERWQRRYEHINAFERMLADEGATVVKFYLHISKDYQKERLQKRLAEPDKHWKFNPRDLRERALWSDYQAAYEEALARCSKPHAPWYVIPAEKRWFRDWLVTRVLVETLESLAMRYPAATFDPATIEIE